MQTIAPALQMLASWPLAVGLWFGLVHAFDADHLATLGALAANDRRTAPLAYAARWAAGHALSLGGVALVALGFGLAQAPQWSAYAEVLVALALIAIGTTGVRGACRRHTARRRTSALTAARSELRSAAPAHSRQHGAAPAPAYSGPHVAAPPPAHDATQPGRHSGSHAEPHLHFLTGPHGHADYGRAGLVLGMLHGGAGSAAVLALLPLAHLSSGSASAAYLACFSVGVTGGALAFAALFGRAAARAAAAGERLAAALQACVGVLATASGALLLWEAARVAHGGG